MVKYDLQKDTIEINFKDRMDIEPGVVFNSDDRDPELIKSFDSKEEALAELQKYKSSIVKHTYKGSWYYVTEYYVEENIYDDEDETEWIDGGDVWEMSKMEIRLLSDSREELGVYSSFAEAQKAELEFLDRDDIYDIVWLY